MMQLKISLEVELWLSMQKDGSPLKKVNFLICFMICKLPNTFFIQMINELPLQGGDIS